MNNKKINNLDILNGFNDLHKKRREERIKMQCFNNEFFNKVKSMFDDEDVCEEVSREREPSQEEIKNLLTQILELNKKNENKEN